MEYKLIMAVSGFPSLYDSSSLTYRDLNIRSDAWRQVAELVGVPESECKRKWKTLRDQHRRERMREKERRESGIGLFNYRPWRYSSVLSFLNPFVDARVAGTNGWALNSQPSQLHAPELVGCSTTTEPRSDDDESFGFAVADATTTSSDLIHRKRPSLAYLDTFRLKEAKLEVNSDDSAPADESMQQHGNMKDLLETVLHSVTSLASAFASSRSTSQLPPSSPHNSLWLKTEQHEETKQVVESDDDDEVEEAASPAQPSWTKRKGVEALLEEFLRQAEARNVQSLEQRDDVTLFLLSLAPAMKRLAPEKQSWLRTKMQQLVHEAEFGSATF